VPEIRLAMVPELGIETNAAGDGLGVEEMAEEGR
jgi:hypothetical protein